MSNQSLRLFRRNAPRNRAASCGKPSGMPQIYPLEDPEHLPRDGAERRHAVGGEVATRVLLECADRALGVQVIVERREDVLGRRVAFDRTKSSAAQRLGERLRTLPCAVEPLFVVIERATVMDVEQVQAERLRRGLLKENTEEEHLADPLRQLGSTEYHWPRGSPWTEHY